MKMKSCSLNGLSSAYRLSYLTLPYVLFLILGSLNASTINNEIPSPIVLVHNRILAKVNGKTISLVDVMKKMNVLINRHYPQVFESKIDTYRFYMTNWRDTLAQMIDHELILADAERSEIKVDDVDIRETLQERFGPNVVATLNQLNLSYEEARDLIQTELIVQKMTWFHINAKAILTVNPKDIKAAYRHRVENAQLDEQWKYQVLTIASENASIGEHLSQTASMLLAQSKSGLLAVVDEMKQMTPEISSTQISISPEYLVAHKDLSEAHQSVLITMKPGEYSKPVVQKRRTDQSTVYRIFHLLDHIKAALPSFRNIEEQLQDELIQQAIDRESESYIAKLRQRFGFDDTELSTLIKSNYQPFTLQQ